MSTFAIRFTLLIWLQSLALTKSFTIQSSHHHRRHLHVVSKVTHPTKTTSVMKYNKGRIITMSPLFNTPTAINNDHDNDDENLPTYGGLLGKITGVSMSAIRQSVRTTTGLSLTATRTALRTLTGVSVTATMKHLFGIFPPWFRYFLQPFFIMYYTPLMILKYFIGSHKNAKKEAFAAHEKIVEGWKDAIRAAEVAQEFWPLHITEDGQIESLTPQSVPINDAILESLDVASTIKNSSGGGEAKI